MKKSFVLGVATGASALFVSVPLLAQFAAAQSTSSASSRPAPSQACIQAMAAKEDAMLSGMDAMTAARKTAMQAHRDALNAAASISDETQRRDAVKKANDDLRTAMKNAMQTKSTSMQTAMDNVKTACGDSLGFRGMHGFGKFGGHRMGGWMRGMHRGWNTSSQSSMNSQ